MQASMSGAAGSNSKPIYKDLIELLSPLTEWQTFGAHLPGITKDHIEKIEQDYKNTDRQKEALYSKWLKIYPDGTWDDVIDALRKAERNDLVIDIQQYISASASQIQCKS